MGKCYHAYSGSMALSVLCRRQRLPAQLLLPCRRLEPDETDGNEGQYVDKQFPTPENRRRRFHPCPGVLRHSSAIDEQMHLPHLVAVELDLAVVLDVVGRVAPPHAVKHFLEAAALRLYSDLHLQVFGNGLARQGMNDDKTT